jgi:hypothetical protein
MKPLISYPGRDNVLLGQGCGTPRGAVMDDYDTTVEWWLAGGGELWEKPAAM